MRRKKRGPEDPRLKADRSSFAFRLGDDPRGLHRDEMATGANRTKASAKESILVIEVSLLKTVSAFD